MRINNTTLSVIRRLCLTLLFHYTQEKPTLQQQLKTIPDRLDGWEDTFELPEGYTRNTMVALTTTKLTTAARREVVRTVASNMLNFCVYPTIKQCEVVASKIVTKYGVGDHIGIAHVSV